MIKVNGATNLDGSKIATIFDADIFESTNGFLVIRKGVETVACFAPGYWSSVEKETAPPKSADAIAES